MISKLLILTLLCLSSAAFAQDSGAEVDASYASKYHDLGLKQGDAGIAINKANAEVDRIQKEADELNKKAQAASANDKGGVTNWGFGKFTSNGYNEDNHKANLALQAQVVAENKKLNDARNALAQAQAQATAVNVEYSQTNAKKNNDFIAASRKVSELDKQLTTTNLLLNFSDLKAKLSTTQRTLDEAERKFDKSLMGAYLERKLGDVLSSKALCSSVKSCKAGGGKASTSEADLKELFPNNGVTDDKFPATSKSGAK